MPDIPNWCWHEYGNRVGFWRFFELYERLGIKPSLSINARVCIDYPRSVEATTKAGWEMVGITSVLLIAFFHTRQESAVNALRTFATYRLCDIGLLIGVLWVIAGLLNFHGLR